MYLWIECRSEDLHGRWAIEIRVVLADNHPIVLDGLQSLFGQQPDMHVVARCVDGEQAVAAVREHKPDVLVLDLRLPKMSGLAVVRELAAGGLSSRVVVFTAAPDEQEALEAVRLGVGGVVLKRSATSAVIEAVRSVLAGRQCIEPELLRRALDAILWREKSPAPELTPRETEIARMVAAGLHNREIADRLGIAEGTVKIHLHKIYDKTHTSSRVLLTLYAQAKGIV